MNDNTAFQPYDWDVHYQVKEDLRDFDDYHLQFMNRKPVRQESLAQFLHPALRHFVGHSYVDQRRFSAFLSDQVGGLIDLANNHANISVERTSMLLDHMQSLIEIFPEQRWRPFLSREAGATKKIMAGIDEALELTKPVYKNADRPAYVHADWRQAQAQLPKMREEFNVVTNSVIVPDGEAIPVPVLQLRSARLAEKQNLLADIALRHAFHQAALVRDSLCLATTMAFLPESYRKSYQEKIDLCAGVAEDMMIAADFTLDEAARLRITSYQSHSLQRPVF